MVLVYFEKSILSLFEPVAYTLFKILIQWSEIISDFLWYLSLFFFFDILCNYKIAFHRSCCNRPDTNAPQSETNVVQYVHLRRLQSTVVHSSPQTSVSSTPELPCVSLLCYLLSSSISVITSSLSKSASLTSADNHGHSSWVWPSISMPPAHLPATDPQRPTHTPDNSMRIINVVYYLK